MPTFSNGYNYRRKITIDYTKVSGSANLTDFATYFKTTLADLKSTGNGGKLQIPNDSNGHPLLDIRFELLDGTKLDHEIVEYNPATGLFTTFFRIPSLSYTANTQVYMFYGKAITAAEDNQYGVWHSSYRGVWHGAHENPYIYNGNTSTRGITGLPGNTVHDIQYGYRSGDLTWILNWFEGASNPGDIQIQGTTFTDHRGNVRTFSSTLPNKSVAFYDAAARDDMYLVYSVQDVHTRFGTNDADGMHLNNHPNFFVAVYSSGWKQLSNGSGALKAFTPVSTDVIVGQFGITAPPNLDANLERRFETGYMPDSTQYAEHMQAGHTMWLNGDSAGRIYEFGRSYAGATYSRAGNNNFNVGSTSEASVSFWLKTSDTNAAIFSYEHSSQGNALLVYLNGGNIGWYRNPSIGNVASASITNNSWHYVTLRWRQSSGGFDIHMDGAMIGSGACVAGALPNNGFLMLGQEQDSPGGGLDNAQALSGLLEEVRFSDDIDFTTGDRHITEYRNMNSPSTFYSVASEETPLTVADAAHTHNADGSLGLVEHKTISLADALQAHIVDNIALTQRHTLVVADAAHGQSMDDFGVLDQNTLLVVADTLHGHEVDAVELIDGGISVPEDALHGHAVDEVVLTQRHFLEVASTTHDHLVDNILIGQAHTLSGVADTLHEHDVEPVTLTQAHLLAISDALHTQTAEEVALFQRHVLAVQDALHDHFADTPFVFTLIPLIVQDSLHGHYVDATLVQVWKKRKPNSVLPGRDLPRIMIIDNTTRTMIPTPARTKPRGAAVQKETPVLMKHKSQPRVRDFPK